MSDVIPEKMTREMLWQLLGDYALNVALSEGVFLTDNLYVLLAVKHREEEMIREGMSK